MPRYTNRYSHSVCPMQTQSLPPVRQTAARASNRTSLQRKASEFPGSLSHINPHKIRLARNLLRTLQLTSLENYQIFVKRLQDSVGKSGAAIQKSPFCDVRQNKLDQRAAGQSVK